MSSLAQFIHFVKKRAHCHVQFLDNNPVEELLFLYRELNAVGGDVVEKGCLAVTFFLACGACQPVGSEARDIRLAVFPHEMNDPICLCKSLIRATGTLEMGRILLGMPGGDVQSKSLCVEKLFLTGGALERQMALVFLHMVVHGVLLLLGDLADRTHE
jgi:hypothetical protein